MFSSAAVASSYQAPSGSGFDTDAQAYFTATGITDATIKNAINTLVLAAKANGWWASSYAIYPFPDATQAHCQVNLKSPGTFDLTFHGGWSFAATGATPNGSTGYADTGLNPSLVIASVNSQFISSYIRTDSLIDVALMGCIDSGNTLYLAIDSGSGILRAFVGTGTDNANISISDTLGLMSGSRVTVFQLKAFKRATASGFAPGSSGSLVNQNIYIGARNNAGTADMFNSHEHAFSIISDGFSDGVVSTMESDIQTFQTSMSRQV